MCSCYSGLCWRCLYVNELLRALPAIVAHLIVVAMLLLPRIVVWLILVCFVPCVCCSLDLYYGSQGEERVLNSTLDGVEDILEAAETSKSCRADTDATIPLAKILLVSLKGDHFSDELQETAIGLAERLPSATTESTITPESLEDAPRALQYL